MTELTELLRPSWGAEKWILEGWNKITADEKQVIKKRMDDLFCDGLPFELKSDKLFYIYTFSLLAQLEVLAIQVPLKFESRMSTPEFRASMRQQLLDEIFHGLVFTKIVYMLCAPLASPPPYSPNIELLCNFIREEECPRVAVMLLNLIGEGWIEEIFYSLHRADIATNVFDIILEDEHRHVDEADLYRDIGMPDIDNITPKIAFLEEQLISNIFMQYKYMVSVCALLGIDGVSNFKQNLHNKHSQQLAKIGLKPGDKWSFFMKFGDGLLPNLKNYTEENAEVTMTPIRKVFMTQWSNPSDPTMAGQFSIDVSPLDFFNRKFPSETLTCLMMQAVSAGLSENDSFRNYLSFRKIFRSEAAYVGLVVKLPACGDHIATIIFKDCHTLSLRELSEKIQSLMTVMTHCYKLREHLEQTSPEIQRLMKDMVYDFAYNSYGYPMAGTPFVSLSNIGYCGYSQCMSPLRCNETMKVTLMEVERRQVWSKETQSFVVQDMLPVSISADHRIFDGNLPVPKQTGEYFNRMFAKMVQEKQLPYEPAMQPRQMKKILDRLIDTNVEMGYKTLIWLQTYWFDFISLEECYQAANMEPA
ncbi:2-oxo acid dehydrogenase subunit E2 [Legionella sp. CNM-4043-24]|uniref:2-oxo acid dehydrogenase subunit E2 n=1 Tax=Legionella sp. CNM-4043-24 TaxID=3421646 RepID=UPI00403B1575